MRRRAYRWRRLWISIIVAVIFLAPATRAADEPRVGNRDTQQYFFDTQGLELGLPGMVALTSLQTRDGYLWVGTQEGLRRFDGVRFVPFRASNTPGFLGHVVRCLYEDREGNLWIGTDAGALRYRDGVFTPVELPDVAVTSIAQDRAGRVWLGTSGRGLYWWESGRLKKFSRDAELPSAAIRCLFVDSADRLWAGFERGDGVVCITAGKVEHYADGDGRPMGDVLTMCELSSGTMWFGTLSRGLLRLENNKFSGYGPWRGLAAMQITDLQPAKDGGLWVAANKLQKITDLDRFVVETIERMPTENVRSICEDQEGNVWLCAQAEGLIRMRQLPYRSISTEDGLPGNGIKTVSEDKQGNLWFAVQRRGVVRLTPAGEVTTFAEKEGFPGNDPALAYAASDGGIWTGVAGNVCVWREDVCTVFSDMSLLRGAFEDSRGRLWLGTEEPGLLYYKDGQFHPVTQDSGQPIPYATSFCEDASGAIYVGTWRDGLFKIEDGRVTVHDQSNGLPVNDVRAVYVDKNGDIWVGLRNRGLAVFHDGRWLNPDALAEVVADNVSAIAEDDRGQLWLGTLAGVMWAPKAELLASAQGWQAPPKMRLLGIGVSSRTASVWSGSQPVVSKTRDGKLMFATRRGALAIDPAYLSFNGNPPPVHIEGIWADRRAVSGDKRGTVPAGTRELKIEYTANSFVQPNLVFFQYKLEGYDLDWIDAGTRRAAYYTHLPPGTYVFRVKACNDDGVWNEVGDEIQIVQSPRFYETWWFWGVVFLIGGASGIGFYRWRTARLRRENEKLNRLIGERTRELELASTAKSEFLESVSHEICNPLNGLNGLLGMLKRESLGARGGDLMISLQACAHTLTRVFEDVLSHSKLEYGYVDLREQVFSLPELLDDVMRAYDWQAQQQGNRLELTLTSDLPVRFMSDEGKLKTIIGNFIANAIKYAPGGLIEIKAEGHPAGPGLTDMHIEVCDHGPGIPPGEQELIFKKFVRGADAKKNRVAGTGLGLATCRVLARALGGSVGVDSEIGRGSTFYVRLPLRHAVETGVIQETGKSGRGLSNTVLIVEDQHYNQVVLRGVAIELGYEPSVASTGEQALSLLEKNHFDVIFLDWELPDIKGGEIARRLRARSDGSRPVIIAITAHDSEAVRRECAEAGMDEFLRKPFDTEQVRRRIAEVSARREGRANAASLSKTANVEPPHLDLKAFDLYVRGAAARPEEAVRRFMEALDVEQQDLADALMQEDAGKMARSAHRLHALAGLIGATEVSEIARCLETLPHVGAAEEGARLFRELEAAIGALKVRVRALSRGESPPA
jgi:signal transduction histidine kinase/ligand-binding sensor domain-containing protein/DNA-binding response OmpR family regulator